MNSTFIKYNYVDIYVWLLDKASFPVLIKITKQNVTVFLARGLKLGEHEDIRQ